MHLTCVLDLEHGVLEFGSLLSVMAVASILIDPSPIPWDLDGAVLSFP